MFLSNSTTWLWLFLHFLKASIISTLQVIVTEKRLTISNIFLGIKIYLITKKDHSIDKDSFSPCGLVEEGLCCAMWTVPVKWGNRLIKYCMIATLCHEWRLTDGVVKSARFSQLFLILARVLNKCSFSTITTYSTWLSQIHSGLKERMKHYCLEEKDLEVRIGA